jgi:hypothetical protein
MKEYKMKLRVMADVHSSGIWEIAPASSRERHIMLDYEELGLPQELADNFSDWIESYWNWKYFDDKKNFDLDTFNQTGKQLAKELKRFLGNDYYVEFEGEAEPPTRKGEEIL